MSGNSPFFRSFNLWGLLKHSPFIRNATWVVRGWPIWRWLQSTSLFNFPRLTMTDEFFTCETCDQTFKKIMSDEESREQDKGSPWLIEGMPQGVICEDCFAKFKVWFATLTEEDHKRYRGEA